MNPSWRNKPWLRATLIVLTVVATVLLASHPELRLLLPLMDSLGLDLLLVLVGAQLLDFARPLLYAAQVHVLRPVWRGFIYFLGIFGPQVEGLWHQHCRTGRRVRRRVALAEGSCGKTPCGE